MKRELEMMSRANAERLEAHAKVIHTFITAQRRGAAEQFGYAFLAGRALLQAKEIVPNGNARSFRTGFRRWVAVNFPEITFRTAENWMRFAEAIMMRAQANASAVPVLFGSAEMSEQSHEAILKLVPEVMDGRGMIDFMRASRLLRPRTRKRSPSAKLSSEPATKETSRRARRAWETILGGLDRGAKVLSCIDKAEDLRRYLAAIVAAGNKIRALLKQLEEKG